MACISLFAAKYAEKVLEGKFVDARDSCTIRPQRAAGMGSQQVINNFTVRGAMRRI